MHTATLSLLNEAQRLSTVTLPAAAITFLLFLVMLSLVATEYPEITGKNIRIPPVVMTPPPPPELRLPTPPSKPLEPAETPAWEPTLAEVEFDTASAISTGPYGEFKPTAGDIEPSGGGGIVAYLKVQPIYPSRPLSRGIEGFVDLNFDITAAGSTNNIRIIASEPAGVFDKAAIDALKKWKYKVPIEDGVATGQRDMATRISFTIDD